MTANNRHSDKNCIKKYLHVQLFWVKIIRRYFDCCYLYHDIISCISKISEKNITRKCTDLVAIYVKMLTETHTWTLRAETGTWPESFDSTPCHRECQRSCQRTAHQPTHQAGCGWVSCWLGHTSNLLRLRPGIKQLHILMVGPMYADTQLDNEKWLHFSQDNHAMWYLAWQVGSWQPTSTNSEPVRPYEHIAHQADSTQAQMFGFNVMIKLNKSVIKTTESVRQWSAQNSMRLMANLKNLIWQVWYTQIIQVIWQVWYTQLIKVTIWRCKSPCNQQF